MLLSVKMAAVFERPMSARRQLHNLSADNEQNVGILTITVAGSKQSSNVKKNPCFT